MDVREKLVELLNEAFFDYNHGKGDGYIPKNFADHLIANGVTVQEWISVDDRLPEINDKERDWSVTVLFRTIQGHIYSGYRNVGSLKQSYYDDDCTPPYWLEESENLDFMEDEVTHWMPMPQPPKGE